MQVNESTVQNPSLDSVSVVRHAPLVSFVDIVTCERENYNAREWRLDHLLSCGQYGSVHVVRRVRLSRTDLYAAKRAHLTVEDNPYRDPNLVMFTLEQMERYEESEKQHLEHCRLALELEIQILYRLRNEPNVVRFEGVAFFNDIPHLIMEMMDMNLHEYMRDERRRRGKRLSSRILINTAIQIAEGLKGCRDAGVLHRDLKPANILVRRSYPFPIVKLSDFGMAKLVVGLVNPKITWRDDIVTLEYRAPELLMGMKYGYGIDVWGWGCIVSEMMTGRLTFSDPSGDCKLDTPETIRGMIFSKIGSMENPIKDTKWCLDDEKNREILELESIIRRGVLVWPNRRWDIYKISKSLSPRLTSSSPDSVDALTINSSDHDATSGGGGGGEEASEANPHMFQGRIGV